MGKVIFSISYEINPEKRTEYLTLMKDLCEQVRNLIGQEYTVYEDVNQPNLMTEVFYLESSSDFEKVKQLQEDNSIDVMDKIEDFLLSKDMVSIRTFREAL